MKTQRPHTQLLLKVNVFVSSFVCLQLVSAPASPHISECVYMRTSSLIMIRYFGVS